VSRWRTAIGCADVLAPEGGWVRRDGDYMSVGCDGVQRSWHLTCNGTAWIGEFGDCTSDITGSSSGRRRRQCGAGACIPNSLCDGLVTTTIRLRFDGRSTTIRLLLLCRRIVVARSNALNESRIPVESQSNFCSRNHRLR